MRLYKLTDANDQTHGGMQWGPGVRHEATGKGKELCTDGWIHAYENKYLAVLLNPTHGDYNPTTMHMWECEGEEPLKRDGQLKVGIKALTTVRRIPLPRFSIEQWVAFGIFCGQAVYKDEAWNRWAAHWLDGTDRSAAARTDAAARAAWAAAHAAAWAAWAACAADAAAWAAWAAARAADIDLSALALKAYRWRDPVKVPAIGGPTGEPHV